jgi:Ca2+-binding RTX toxin-like protein
MTTSGGAGATPLPDRSYTRGSSMKRLYILLAAMIVMLAAPLFGAHVALAGLVTGTALNDTLYGTEGVDYLKGRAGDDYLDAGGDNDTIEGGRGDDRIIPGEGADVVIAGAGNDRIYARDTASEDVIDCGAGFDKVETIHRDDITKSNCERSLGPRKGNID